MVGPLICSTKTSPDPTPGLFPDVYLRAGLAAMFSDFKILTTNNIAIQLFPPRNVEEYSKKVKRVDWVAVEGQMPTALLT